MSKDESKVPKIVHQEVTRGEMKQRYIDLLGTQDGYYLPRTKEEMAEANRFDDAILRVIESRKVSRESFDKCVNRLSYWSKTERGLSEEFAGNRIMDMLTEAGVEVEK